MEKTVAFHLMGQFEIVAGQNSCAVISKSRKGAALVQYLILNNGKKITSQRLCGILWSEYLHANPMNALKTLVSRVRKILNDVSEGLGSCIVSERGYYSWVSQPGVSVDVLEMMNLFETLALERDAETRTRLYERLLSLYQGDLCITGAIAGDEAYQAALHNQFLNAVYDYVDSLIQGKKYADAIRVCRGALRIDELDERLNMELMHAQVESNCVEDAMEQFRRVSSLSKRYLDAEPGEEIEAFYQKLAESDQAMGFSLESVGRELWEAGGSQRAHLCDKTSFQSMFHVLSSTLERLGCSLYLGLIYLDFTAAAGQSLSAKTQSKAVDALTGIILANLRRGDIVTKYSETVVALLLPGVNHTTGNMIMERIRHQFFEETSFGAVPFHYRIGEMTRAGVK